MENQVSLTINQRVSPRVPTKGNMTYGYVRELGIPHQDGPAVLVYWPEIKACGIWPVHALKPSRKK